MFWGDVVARAAGLRGQLLGPAVTERCAAARSPAELAQIVSSSYRGETDARAARSFTERLDELLDERTERHLRLLSRWCGLRASDRRREALAVIFDDADRRSLATLLRAVAGSVEPERGLRAAAATPGLPRGLLGLLAHAESAEELAQILRRAGHPAASCLDAATPRAAASLLHRLTALDRWWVERARRGSGADPALGHWVRDVIDERNLGSAVSLAGVFAEDPDTAEEFFLEGGEMIDRRTFRQVVASRRSEAPAILAARWRAASERSELYQLLAESPTEVAAGALTAAALADQLRTQRRLARLDPLCTAPIVVGWLEFRREASKLRRIAWRLEWSGNAT